LALALPPLAVFVADVLDELIEVLVKQDSMS
jgi:hypothetical protein